MIKIYHNPRCRKSREALQILQESGKDFEIIEYLKESLSFDEVKAIIDLLNIPPIKLLRKNEAVWKEHFEGHPQVIKQRAPNKKQST
jgi:arsenate reductase